VISVRYDEETGTSRVEGDERPDDPPFDPDLETQLDLQAGAAD